ncbi:TPA: hypothetical protein ACH3X3_007972 [Trebouxia sp. C0006]
MSDDEQGFPTEADTAVEFGWEDARPLTGRRLKAAKDKQKRTKAGSFDSLGLSLEVVQGSGRCGHSANWLRQNGCICHSNA